MLWSHFSEDIWTVRLNFINVCPSWPFHQTHITPAQVLLELHFWSCLLLHKRNWYNSFFFKMLSQWALFLAEALHWTCSHLSLTPLKMLPVRTSWCSQHRQPSKWLRPTIPMKMGLAPIMVSGSPRAQLLQQDTELEYESLGCYRFFCVLVGTYEIGRGINGLRMLLVLKSCLCYYQDHINTSSLG